MKKVVIYLIMPLIILILMAGRCKPCVKPVPCADIVGTATIVWDDTNKLVNVSVANVGSAAAESFMVYVDADENPVSSNHRPQVRHTISGLSQGEIIILPVSDFKPLSHPDNNYLGNVTGITVTVDSKNMVAECDSTGELNNEIHIPIP